MSKPYLRGLIWWIQYYDENGKRIAESTKQGDEAKAVKILAAIERRIKMRKAMAAGDAVNAGPLTVAGYAARWIADRKRRKITTASKEDYRFRTYVFPFILDDETVSGAKTFGDLRPEKVRPRHLRNLVRHLKSQCGPGKDQLAPRTVRHIYGALRTMFGDMVGDELLDANPCTLKKGELPKKVDKDPAWRGRAVFTRDEVELLISDERVPEENRMLYAILFLAGMRIGEVAARRWADYDPKARPLGRLVVPTSWSRQQKRIKGLKTEVPREVPVHPTLAKALAVWKLSGFERYMGRAPRSEDLLVPSPTGGYLDDTVVLERLGRDLETLGLRRRTTHNTRRTFISIARADGANKDVIKSMTHGAQGDQVDDYTTFPWATLCEAILKIQVSLLEGRVLALPMVSGASIGPSGHLLQSLLQSKMKTEITEENHMLMPSAVDCTRGESKPHPSQSFVQSRDVLTGSPQDYNTPNAESRHGRKSERSNVAGDILLTAGQVELIRSMLRVGKFKVEDFGRWETALRLLGDEP